MYIHANMHGTRTYWWKGVQAGGLHYMKNYQLCVVSMPFQLFSYTSCIHTPTVLYFHFTAVLVISASAIYLSLFSRTGAFKQWIVVEFSMLRQRKWWLIWILKLRTIKTKIIEKKVFPSKLNGTEVNWFWKLNQRHSFALTRFFLSISNSLIGLFRSPNMIKLRIRSWY